MTEFVERHGLGHVPQAVDHERRVWALFDIPAQPAWVFIDGSTGQVRRHLGELSPDALREVLAELAAATQRASLSSRSTSA